MATSNLIGPEKQGYFEMGSVKTTSEGLVSWAGSSMAPLRVYTKTAGQMFEAPGSGVYNVLSSCPVPKGSLDIWTTTGATGTARLLAALYDVTTSARILVGLDTTNRPQCVVTDNLGNSVFTSTPAGSTIVTGTRMHLQLLWDALTPLAISLTDRVALYRDGALVTSGRTTSWTPFVAPSLHVGRTVLAFSDVNGSVESVQIGNQPIL